MAAPPIKFNFKDLLDLDEDLRGSVKSLPVIVQRVLSLQLRKIRREQLPLVPRGATGALRRSLGVSVRKIRGNVLATYGFMTGRRVTANAAIAANVLQKPGATPKKGEFLWIPLGANKNIKPRDFFSAENTFIRTTASGNKVAFARTDEAIVPLFVLKKSVKLSMPPVPIEQKVEGQLPEITTDIQDTLAQVIEARRAALGNLTNE